MSSTTLPVCPKTGSTSPSLTVHLCLHTALLREIGNAPPVMSTAYFFVFLGALFVTICDSYISYNTSHDRWHFPEYALYVLLAGLTIHAIRLYVSLHGSDDPRFQKEYTKPLDDTQKAIEWSLRLLMVFVVSLKLAPGFKVTSQYQLAIYLFVFFFTLLLWDIVVAWFFFTRTQSETQSPENTVDGGQANGKGAAKQGDGKKTNSSTEARRLWKKLYSKYAVPDCFGFVAAIMLLCTAPGTLPHFLKNGSVACFLQWILAALQWILAAAYTLAVLIYGRGDLDFLHGDTRRHTETHGDKREGSAKEAKGA